MQNALQDTTKSSLSLPSDDIIFELEHWTIEALSESLPNASLADTLASARIEYRFNCVYYYLINLYYLTLVLNPGRDCDRIRSGQTVFRQLRAAIHSIQQQSICTDIVGHICG